MKHRTRGKGQAATDKGKPKVYGSPASNYLPGIWTFDVQPGHIVDLPPRSILLPMKPPERYFAEPPY